MIGVSRPQQGPKLSLDVAPRAVGLNLEHLQGPVQRIVPGSEVGQGSGAAAQDGGDEGTIDRAIPYQGRSEGGEDGLAMLRGERPRSVESSEGLLDGGAEFVFELEGQGVSVGDQAVTAPKEPNAVGLESVANPRLGNSTPRGQILQQDDQILANLGGNAGPGVGGDPGQEETAGAGSGVDGEIPRSERYSTRRSDRSRVMDLQFGDNHPGYGTVGSAPLGSSDEGYAMSDQPPVDKIDPATLRVRPGDKPDLAAIDPRATPGWNEHDKKLAKARTFELNLRLEELQERLWAGGSERLLVVLQAMDAGGKDSTVKHVFEHVNPTGVKVANFKKPSERELSHDYLWRVHAHAPAAGELTIFNRSHYEEVLVVRVMNLVDESVWRKRYRHIREFERMLSDEGTTIVKIFLHISRDEQRERFQDRLNEPDKHWKFNADDLIPRAHWDDYMEAFTEALAETSTDYAPWYVVPADRKWYRNLVISEIMVDTLDGMNITYPEAPPNIASVVIPE